MRGRALLLLILGASILTGCTAGGGQAVLETPRELQPDLEHAVIAELCPGVWTHTSWHTFPNGATFPSNGLIIRDGDELILIDTAWGAELTVDLLGRIDREIGLPVRRAVVTHSHEDRVAGVDVLQSSGIRVDASAMTRARTIAQGKPTPAHTLEGINEPGSSVRVGSIEVLYPGHGHAPDNLMVWVPSARVLFGGCAVRAQSDESVGNREDADLAKWTDAIRRARDRYGEQAEVVVPGHGDPGDATLLGHTLELLYQGVHGTATSWQHGKTASSG